MDNEEGLFAKLFLRKWHPQPTIKCGMIIFVINGILCLIFGITVLVLNSKINDVTIQNYHTLGNCSQSAYDEIDGSKNLCTFYVNLPKMDGPVYFFYQLTNFYQNHRRYIKSKGINQLANINFQQSEADSLCQPVTKFVDLHRYQEFYTMADGTRVNRNTSPTLKPVPNDTTANPCGLIAKSFFNDTYKLNLQSANSQLTAIPIRETGISWPGDVGTKFKTGNSSITWIDVTNEHFIVWMRPAALPNFKKLWGVIESGLPSGNYSFSVQNNYNPSTYKGDKNIYLSTSTGMGGKNSFLGVAFIVTGVLCFIFIVLFQLNKSSNDKQLGLKQQ